MAGGSPTPNPSLVQSGFQASSSINDPKHPALRRWKTKPCLRVFGTTQRQIALYMFQNHFINKELFNILNIKNMSVFICFILASGLDIGPSEVRQSAKAKQLLPRPHSGHQQPHLALPAHSPQGRSKTTFSTAFLGSRVSRIRFGPSSHHRTIPLCR